MYNFKCLKCRWLLLVWPRSEAYKSRRATADTASFQQLCICTWSGFGFVHRPSVLKLYIANLDYNTVFSELLKVSKYYSQCNFLLYSIIGFKNYQSFHYRTHGPGHVAPDCPESTE